MDKIQKVLSGEFAREDVLELIPIAKDAKQRETLLKLATMTATRAQRKQTLRNLRVTVGG